jgi:mxaK protein
MRRRFARIAALGCLASGAGLVAAGADLEWRARTANAAIAALGAGRDVAVAADAPQAVLAARAIYLIGRHDLAGAQAIADGMANDADGTVRASVLFALGNAHMRQAYVMISKLPFWKVRPVIALAKSEYRQSVQLDPGDWNARYNYAIASSLVHDQEPAKPTTGDAMSHERAAWPDIPGAPNGMP